MLEESRRLLLLPLGVASLVILSVCVIAAAPQKLSKQNLPESYKTWLDRDVVYIITRTEHDAFLRLVSNEDRDRFIENFWELRNPTPGAPTNPFREEHYKRMAYANTYFGKASGNNGWRTDMGRVYIVLGPPQQKSTYHDSQSIRPMEVWFYQNVSPALPPYFYVVFYREDNFSEYKLYSPYFDGPEKLVTTRGDTRYQAWVTIDKEGGRELARIALSLLPDEPADTQQATSSMQSDLMLARLRDLPNHPLSIEQLNLRRQMNSVTSLLVAKGDSLGVLAIPLRDSSGATRVDYALHFSKPEDFSLEESSGGHYKFNINVRVDVFTKDEKHILSQDRTYTKTLSKEQVEKVKERLFGYEGTLPLTPGSYLVRFTLADLVKKVSYHAQQEVVVPEVPKDALMVSSIVPFIGVKQLSPGERDIVPFGFGDVKFVPLLKREAAYASGNQLKFFYQIWGPPQIASDAPGQKVKLKYAYGRPGGRMEAEFLTDVVDRSQFDVNGSLVNGKEMELGNWAPGNYKLVLTLMDPMTNLETYSTLDFRLGQGYLTPSPWGIDDREDTIRQLQNGERDYERGMCYLVHGKSAEASVAFQKALEKDPTSQAALTALVDADFTRKAYGEVAKYAARVQITEHTEERTILQLAQSLQEAGDVKNAIGFLEGALKGRKATSSVYLTLAEYYGREGLTEKATEYEKKGKQLLAQSELKN